MREGSAKEEEIVVAIDIGGGTTKIALVDRLGEVRRWRSFPTSGENGEAFLEQVVQACQTLEAEAEAPAIGVSAAVAGFVTAEGALEYNPNLPWLERTPIAASLAARLGLPVVVEADSNAACLAEYLLGEGRGSSRFLCMTGGTGLGVGMVIEGKLLRIAYGCMGDAGHVIVAPEGPACTCGGRGCAEALLSTAALGQHYAELTHTKGGFRSLVRAARSGDRQAGGLLTDAGYWLGIATASLATIFMPDRIAVAGGLSQAGDAFFEAAQASFRAHCGTLPLSRTTLVRATTGEHATLLGAAAGFFHPDLL
jgi:glucokinase